MTSTSRRPALFAAALLLGFVGAAAATPADDARATMQGTVDDVLAVLGDTSLSQQAKRDHIQTIAYERFDFVTMSKLVLKRDWKRFDTTQRDEFVAEFKEHLSARYGEDLGRYENEKVEVTSQQSETNGDVTVETVIRGGRFDGTPVNYRLRNASDWLVIDVVIENVSLVSSFRKQFADVLERSGPEGVLERLKKKNAQREAAKAETNA
jgi:phospholipid transport system substrate-binding protein